MRGETALHTAVLGGKETDLRLAQALIKAGADKTIPFAGEYKYKKYSNLGEDGRHALRGNLSIGDRINTMQQLYAQPDVAAIAIKRETVPGSPEPFSARFARFLAAEARQRRAELIRTGKMPNARVDDDFAKVRPDIPMGYTEDANGRPQSFKGADGFWEERKRDAADREVYFEDSNGDWRKIAYDDASNTRTILTGGQDGHWEEVVQDQNGRELTRVDSRGNRREMTRDDTGRVVKIKCIDSKGDWNETTRDANGRELTYKTNTGFVRETTRDDSGRATKIRLVDADGAWQETVRNSSGAEVSYKDSSGAWRESGIDQEMALAEAGAPAP